MALGVPRRTASDMAARGRLLRRGEARLRRRGRRRHKVVAGLPVHRVLRFQGLETGRFLMTNPGLVSDAPAGNGFLVGVDIGGTKVAAGVVDAAGEIKRQSRKPMVARG